MAGGSRDPPPCCGHDGRLHARNRNLIGIVSLCLGVFDLLASGCDPEGPERRPCGDAGNRHPLAWSALPILLVMVHIECGLGRLTSRNWQLLLLRGLILLVSYTTYYMAFPALPLAEAIALFFISPIFVTILASLFLREKVTPQAWVAVIAGFIGVLIILQPGIGAVRARRLAQPVQRGEPMRFSMVLARKFGADEPSTVMAFYVNGVYMVARRADRRSCFSLRRHHRTRPSEPRFPGPALGDAGHRATCC